MTDNELNGEDLPIGWHGECSWGNKAAWFECVIIPSRKIAMHHLTNWVINDISTHLEFRPLKSDRDKAVDAAIDALSNEKIGFLDGNAAFFGALYDAGLLRLPD